MKEKSTRESQLVTTEIKNLNVRNAVSKVNKSFFSMREKSVRESQLARKHARSLLFLHPLLLGVRSVLLFYHHHRSISITPTTTTSIFFIIVSDSLPSSSSFDNPSSCCASPVIRSNSDSKDSCNSTLNTQHFHLLVNYQVILEVIGRGLWIFLFSFINN